MSTRQIARSVLGGHKVTFAYERMEPVVGYVAGMDEYHWLVLDPKSLRRRLVHKGLAPIVDIDEEPSYLEEKRLADLEEVIAPFRKNLSERYGPDTITNRVQSRTQGANQP